MLKRSYSYFKDYKSIVIINRHGFGNWSEIAELIGGAKSREEIEEHYFTLFLENSEYLPVKKMLI